MGGKGKFVQLNDGDVITIALPSGDPDATLPMYTVKVVEVPVPKPPAKAADPKPAKRQREVVRPAVSQDWPVDLREQEELHRLLLVHLRSLDEASHPLGLVAVVREKVREKFKALSSIIESRGR